MSVKAKLFAGPEVALTVLLVVSYFGTAGAGKAGGYVETDLVVGGPHATLVKGVPTLIDANGITHTANFLDPNLVNSWGLTEIPTGSPFWISDNGSGLSTLYSVNPSPLTRRKVNRKRGSSASPRRTTPWERAERRPARLGTPPR